MLFAALFLVLQTAMAMVIRGVDTEVRAVWLNVTHPYLKQRFPSVVTTVGYTFDNYDELVALADHAAVSSEKELWGDFLGDYVSFKYGGYLTTSFDYKREDVKLYVIDLMEGDVSYFPGNRLDEVLETTTIENYKILYHSINRYGKWTGQIWRLVSRAIFGAY